MSPTEKRTSKSDWFEAALRVLEAESVSQVRIEQLARDLGTSRSGFYWHFQNRSDLLAQLLEFWADEYTGVVVNNPEVRALKPRERLTRAARMVAEHRLDGYELSFVSWGKRDAQVDQRVKAVIRKRRQFVEDAFAELGVTGPDLELRTRLFLGYLMWNGVTFPRTSGTRSRDLIPSLVRLLTS